MSDLVEHAVITRFKLSGDGMGADEERQLIFSLEKRLDDAIARADVGEHDGNEFGGGEAVLFSYGPDADRLYAVMEPVLKSCPLRPATAVLRYGEPDDEHARSVQIDL